MVSCLLSPQQPVQINATQDFYVTQKSCHTDRLRERTFALYAGFRNSKTKQPLSLGWHTNLTRKMGFPVKRSETKKEY